ncbi:MAG: CHAT domain-containing protein, partial [Acidobacteriota bacterium]
AALHRRLQRPVEDRIRRLLEPALELSRADGFAPGEAASLLALSRAERERGDPGGGAARLDEAAAIYDRIGHRQGAALVAYDRGNRHMAKERYGDAHAAYGEACALFEALGQRSGGQVCAIGRVRLQLRTDQLERARRGLEPLLAELGPTTVRRYALWLSGHIALHAGDPGGAVDAYRQVLDLGRRLGIEDPAASSDVWAMLGQAGLQLGDLSAADDALAEARRLAADRGVSNALVVALLSSADLAFLKMQTAGDADVARTRAEEAVDLVEAAVEVQVADRGARAPAFFLTHFVQASERLRMLLLEWDLPPAVKARAHRSLFRLLELTRLRSPAVRASTVGAVPSPEEAEALRGLVAALESQGDRAARGDRAALRGTYRRYAASVRGGEGESHSGDRSTEPISLEAVPELRSLQRRLGVDGAVVFYAFGRERAYALLVGEAAEVTVALPLSLRQAYDQTALLVDLMSQEVSGAAPAPGAWRPVAAGLHRALIQPLYAAGLRPGMTLSIVPIGPLRQLPWAALGSHDDPDGSLLMERHLVTTAPSARSLLAGRSVSAGGLAVAAGVGVEGPELVDAVAEAAEVAALADVEAALAGRATEGALRRALPRRLIHLAVHGEVEPELPLLSRLALSPPSSAEANMGEDGRLTVGEILRLDVDAELVVLSACRGSASYTPRYSDWSKPGLGLADAFLAAGAQRVISSQLPVSDAGARRLMVDFYRELVRHPPAVALRRAQLRAATDRDLAWAGFGISGALPTSGPAFLSAGEE